ncbi:Uncharacterised protein [Mycobacteroides abscessus subsp. bolletii]|nr:Uncharacterised protein [Mycobacteroides abscessus subsp. bolletii]
MREIVEERLQTWLHRVYGGRTRRITGCGDILAEYRVERKGIRTCLR